MNSYGHATPEEQEHVQALEARLDASTSPLGEMLELALLYIEPCHRQETAVSLLQAILKRDPTDSAVKIWIAYCCRWAVMSPEWLRYAQGLLQEIVASEPDPQLVAGAYLMLAQLSRELAFPKWNEPDALAREIELLQASVERAPSWVNNHVTLAWAYKHGGRLADAIREMQRAVENIVPRDPEWDLPTWYFEADIMGRPVRTDWVHRELEKMKAEAQS